MKMNKRIILVGAGGSGKDYFKDYLKNKGYPVDVSYTTRPPRKGEIEGETYHYVCEEEFDDMYLHGAFYEHVEFNGWKYGTTVKDWESKKLCIKTPSGIAQLTDKDREESIIVYFDIPEVVRYKRLLERKGADNVERRLEADKKDFKGFKEFNIRVTNLYYSCEILEELIEKYDEL